MNLLQSETEFEYNINLLDIGTEFIIRSKDPLYHDKMFTISRSGTNAILVHCIVDGGLYWVFNSLDELQRYFINSFKNGLIYGCQLKQCIQVNQMSFSAFRTELSKLDYNTLLHLYTSDNKEKIYKLKYVEPVSGYDAPYNVCLVNIECPTDFTCSVRSRTKTELIDYICMLFEQNTYCSCKIEIINEYLDNNNYSNEDKVDLINYNSYIKLTDYTNTEYEYVVGTVAGTYASDYIGLYGVGNTTFNPHYENLDMLKRQLKADISSGKYTNIEVLQSLEGSSILFENRENCITNNSATTEISNPNLYYPYKRYEIIQHKDYGIGIVNDNTFTFNNSRTSASCKFWNSFKWKYLNKYCTQKSISIYYPNITEIAKQKLDCFTSPIFN